MRTRELVRRQGQWHSIPAVRINPLLVQRPIPIWMGGESEVVLRRAARVADGWMPHFRPGLAAQPVVDRVHGYVKEAGRAPADFGIEGRLTLSQVPRRNGRRRSPPGKTCAGSRTFAFTR